MWEDDEKRRLEALQSDFERHSLLLMMWPEVLPSVCRERLSTSAGSVRRTDEPSDCPRSEPEQLGAWLEEATKGHPRLDRVRCDLPNADDGPIRSMLLPAGQVVRVLASAEWVYALSANGRLLAWKPEPGYSGEFPKRDSPVVAIDSLPGGGIVVGRRDGTVWLWPPSRPWKPVRLYTHPAAVTALDALVDANGAVLVGHEDGFGSSAALFDLLRPSAIITLCGDHRIPIRRLTRHSPAGMAGMCSRPPTGQVWSSPTHPLARSPSARRGVPLTAVLPLSTGGVLLGWKNWTRHPCRPGWQQH